MPARKTLEDRLKQIVVDANGCWLWPGYVTDRGYGQLTCHGKTFSVHRWFYEQCRGPIPVWLESDHTCRVRRCVNPWHVDLVTHRVNLLRKPALIERMTSRYCIYGHLFEGMKRDGQRYCLKCATIRVGHYQREKRNDVEFRKKRRARWLAYEAFPVSQLCERCGVLRADRHHDDYDKPLEIRWLCRRCHRRHHVVGSQEPAPAALGSDG